jgi:hypothetical protein
MYMLGMQQQQQPQYMPYFDDGADATPVRGWVLIEVLELDNWSL